MNHYICTGGCGGVSKSPGVCKEETCPKHGLPLTECNCTDGKHEGAAGFELDLELSEGEKEEEKETSEEQIKKVSEAVPGMSLGSIGVFIAGAVVGGVVGASAGLLLCQSTPTISPSSAKTGSEVVGTSTSVPLSDPRVTSSSAEVSDTPVSTDGSAPSTTTSSSDTSSAPSTQ